MNTQIDYKFRNMDRNIFENQYYAEAKRRLELLRIMGLLDGPLLVTIEDVEQWCRDRDSDPDCAQLDSLACRKIFDLDHGEQ